MTVLSREAELYEAIRLVRPLHRHVHRSVELALAAEGIGVGMRAVLERLHEAGAETVPQVARALGIRRQFIQRVADNLLARGLVERVPNPAHRRSHLLGLTPAGAALIRRVLEREAATLREVAAPLSDDEIRCFRRVMFYLTDLFTRRAPFDPEVVDDPG